MEGSDPGSGAPVAVERTDATLVVQVYRVVEREDRRSAAAYHVTRIQYLRDPADGSEELELYFSHGTWRKVIACDGEMEVLPAVFEVRQTPLRLLLRRLPPDVLDGILGALSPDAAALLRRVVS